MPLAERLAIPPAPKRRNIIDTYLQAASEEDRAALEAALKDFRFSSYYLADVLGDEGYDVHASSIANWRRKNL